MQEGPWTPQNKPVNGTLVTVNPEISTKYPGVWKVIKQLQVNVLLERENGVGKKLRIRAEYLLPAPEKAPVNPLYSTAIGGLTETPAVVTTIPVYDVLHLGNIVKVAGPGWKQPADRLFVVLADNTYKNNTVKIVELGGNEKDSHWPKVPRGYLTVVPLADVLK